MLFLISIGLTLIFGIMRIVNFAHGALYMLGAYAGFTVATLTGSYWLALLLAPVAVAAIGVATHQFWLLLLGYGVLGGIGLGLGYISPVTTLIRWFPDRPGMATGMAIMGFGGGAFVAGYLNVYLMNQVGVAVTMMVLGALYLTVMLIGARLLVPPPPGYRPPNWEPRPSQSAMISDRSVSRNDAIVTRQFYLLWGILLINVTAGIGILAQASPMMQDMFGRTPAQAAAVRRRSGSRPGAIRGAAAR